MRLINTDTLDFDEFIGDEIPNYAILSHKWREEELTFQAWADTQTRASAVGKRGYIKIKRACTIAMQHSCKHIWIDTVCINKESSAELSEAINSMFAWYQNAAVCLSWIDDFTYKPSSALLGGLEDARWFTRGWTLQELLAPKEVVFFDANWSRFGSKETLSGHLSRITGIQTDHLLVPGSIFSTTVARRMSWASTRKTTREEGIAYCLLGIFEINMPLLYGEGVRAFIRLQEEIIKYSNDRTIFCWEWPEELNLELYPSWYSCLAPRPITFKDSGNFRRHDRHNPYARVGDPLDFQLTNNGLRINAPILDCMEPDFKLVIFNVSDEELEFEESLPLAVCMQLSQGPAHLARSRVPNRLLRIPKLWESAAAPQTVYLYHERNPNKPETSKWGVAATVRSSLSNNPPPSFGLLPVYSFNYTRFLWEAQGRPEPSYPMVPPELHDRYGPIHGLASSRKQGYPVLAKSGAFSLYRDASCSLKDRTEWLVRTNLHFKRLSIKDSTKTRDSSEDWWQVALTISTESTFEFEVGVLAENGVMYRMKVIPIMLAPEDSDLYIDAEDSGESTAVKVMSTPPATTDPVMYQGTDSTDFSIQELGSFLNSSSDSLDS